MYFVLLFEFVVWLIDLGGVVFVMVAVVVLFAVAAASAANANSVDYLLMVLGKLFVSPELLLDFLVAVAELIDCCSVDIVEPGLVEVVEI